MKASEIEVGGIYTAKVGLSVTKVRVDAIRETTTYRNGKPHDTVVYDVTNIATKRKTMFRSAAKFRSRADAKTPVSVKVKPKINSTQFGAAQSGFPEDGGTVGGPSFLPERIGLGAVVREHRSTDPLDKSPHVIVQARAGTGKTTTLIEGLCVLKGFTPTIEPSPQQAAVWEQLKASKNARTICFVAFNKSIADELSRRVPRGVDAMTMHSLGFRAVQKALGRQQPNSYVVLDYICEHLETDVRDLRKNKPNVLNATERLVSLVKQNLVEPTAGELDKLADHYAVDLNGDRTEVYELVATIIQRCKNPKGRITFDDMIWLPVVLNLPTVRYDLLLVDEAQDLNRCQQALAKKCGDRLILVGDDRQAIYGFAGADSESMRRMGAELSAEQRGCTVLPLTVTRRCGKAIVAEAQNYVAEFAAHESNHDGQIRRMKYKDGLTRQKWMEICQCTEEHNPQCPANDESNVNYDALAADDDMILCRVNAPLVSQCFRFLRAGRKATIRGRDVGQGLISTISKLTKGMDDCGMTQFTGLLSDWYHAETAKEQAKKFPSATKLEGLDDRYECLVCFTEGCKTTSEMIRKIESIFSDTKAPGVTFSSIHRAKGLEARRVFWLTGGGFKRDMKDWERDQEANLCYVAITRAIEELVYVPLPERGSR